MKLRAIAIDDEPLALEVIRRFAGKTPQLDLIGVFQNPVEALDFLQHEDVDLLFLDIHMPDLTGMQFIQSMSEQPLVIFTTAYSQYAVDSYELNAVDYLLKPIPFDRFLKAVNKAAQVFRSRLPQDDQPGGKDYLFVKSDTRYFKVNFPDILYIEGMRDYIAVHTVQKQRILTLMSMTAMLSRLPGEHFMRVHKSYIVGLDHITLIQNSRIYIGEREIPVSNSYKDELLRFVGGVGEE
ncbi:MAG: LytTR family DNA-binding domain-containing protein [Bacteroidia bacterium]